MSFSDQRYEPHAGSLATAGPTGRDVEEGSFSVIDRFSVFDGRFTAERDLRIDGEVKGTIECKGTLFVAEGAIVNARIEAENITVAGDLTGDIDCTGRLRLLPSGKLRGKVHTRAFVIAQGAVYDGELVMEPRAGNGQPAAEPRAAETSPAPAPRTAARRAPRPQTGESEAVEPVGPSTFIRRLGGPETPWDNQERNEASPEPEQAES
jgi:cytoskeletal protein CcmA (bactofilin family)